MHFTSPILALGLLGAASANVIKRAEDTDYRSTTGKIYVTYNAPGDLTGFNKDAVRGCIVANGSFVSDTSLCATFTAGSDGNIASTAGACEWKDAGDDALRSVLHCPIAYPFSYAHFAALTEYDPGQGEAWLFAGEFYYTFGSTAANDTPAQSELAQIATLVAGQGGHLNLLWKRI